MVAPLMELNGIPGVVITLGNNTGKVSYTIKGWTGGDKIVQVTSYRGLEVPFEYLWMLADDILVWNKEDSIVAYLCEDPTKFTSHSDTATSVPDINTNSFSSKGYSFPDDTTGAGSTTGFCDYFWTTYNDATPGRGWYGALLAARASYGALAGFGCLAADYRSSNAYANIGFRLCRF